MSQSVEKGEYNSILIHNMPEGISKDEIFKKFKKYGIIKALQSYQRKHPAIKIEYDNAEEAAQAKQEMNYHTFHGQEINIQFFLDKEKKNEIKHNNIVIKNVPLNISQQELHEEFSKYGEIFSLFLKKGEDKANTGIGYVQFFKNSDKIKILEKQEQEGGELTLTLPVQKQIKLKLEEFYSKNEEEALLQMNIGSQQQGQNIQSGISNLIEDQILSQTPNKQTNNMPSQQYPQIQASLKSPTSATQSLQQDQSQSIQQQQGVAAIIGSQQLSELQQSSIEYVVIFVKNFLEKEISTSESNEISQAQKDIEQNMKQVVETISDELSSNAPKLEFYVQYNAQKKNFWSHLFGVGTSDIFKQILEITQKQLKEEYPMCDVSFKQKKKLQEPSSKHLICFGVRPTITHEKVKQWLDDRVFSANLTTSAISFNLVKKKENSSSQILKNFEKDSQVLYIFFLNEQEGNKFMEICKNNQAHANTIFYKPKISQYLTEKQRQDLKAKINSQTNSNVNSISGNQSNYKNNHYQNQYYQQNNNSGHGNSSHYHNNQHNNHSNNYNTKNNQGNNYYNHNNNNTGYNNFSSYNKNQSHHSVQQHPANHQQHNGIGNHQFNQGTNQQNINNQNNNQQHHSYYQNLQNHHENHQHQPNQNNQHSNYINSGNQQNRQKNKSINPRSNQQGNNQNLSSFQSSVNHIPHNNNQGHHNHQGSYQNNSQYNNQSKQGNQSQSYSFNSHNNQNQDQSQGNMRYTANQTSRQPTNNFQSGNPQSSKFSNSVNSTNLNSSNNSSNSFPSSKNQNNLNENMKQNNRQRHNYNQQNNQHHNHPSHQNSNQNYHSHQNSNSQNNQSHLSWNQGGQQNQNSYSSNQASNNQHSNHNNQISHNNNRRNQNVNSNQNSMAQNNYFQTNNQNSQHHQNFNKTHNSHNNQNTTSIYVQKNSQNNKQPHNQPSNLSNNPNHHQSQYNGYQHSTNQSHNQNTRGNNNTQHSGQGGSLNTFDSFNSNNSSSQNQFGNTYKNPQSNYNANQAFQSGNYNHLNNSNSNNSNNNYFQNNSNSNKNQGYYSQMSMNNQQSQIASQGPSNNDKATSNYIIPPVHLQGNLMVNPTAVSSTANTTATASPTTLSASASAAAVSAAQNTGFIQKLNNLLITINNPSNSTALQQNTENLKQEILNNQNEFKQIQDQELKQKVIHAIFKQMILNLSSSEDKVSQVLNINDANNIQIKINNYNHFNDQICSLFTSNEIFGTDEVLSVMEDQNKFIQKCEFFAKLKTS